MDFILIIINNNCILTVSHVLKSDIKVKYHNKRLNSKLIKLHALHWVQFTVYKL